MKKVDFKCMPTHILERFHYLYGLIKFFKGYENCYEAAKCKGVINKCQVQTTPLAVQQ